MGEIYNISSALPFLESLAKGVVERFAEVDKVTIYLPNKRSVPALVKAFAKYSEAVPIIEVIGDIDEEELQLHDFSGADKVPKAISQTDRLYRMARLVHEKQPLKNFHPDFAQSVALARSLLQLVDELQNMDLDFASLEKVVPDEFAEHWQITLDFLKVVSVDWQEELAKRGLIEPIMRRNRLIDKLAENYRLNGMENPVVIAGTTGTIPATQRLIKTVSENENGFIVLRGLDRNLADEDFKTLAETHSQYALSLLLKSVGKEPDKIAEWEDVPVTQRQKYVSTALFPTERTAEWRDVKCGSEGVYKIECANLEEEAMAIAVLLREALESRDKTAMVVTNNRQLAERIAVKMQIWNVDISDIAGQSLLKLPVASYLLELVEMVRQKQAPIPLLSFFKHPFVPLELKRQIRELEVQFLRGPRRERFDIADHGIVIPGLKEFEQIFQRNETNFFEMIRLHMELAMIIGGEEIWAGESEQVLKFIDDLKGSINRHQNIDPKLYVEILARFLGSKFYEPPAAIHPRLRILSPIEARMQSADLVVLAGMNEGDMPQLPEQDSFMNQQIRSTIGLYLIGMRIGQSAHDFELMSQAPMVVYTRSTKVGGSPAIKSRFLQRLDAVCKIETASKYLDWARGFYEPDSFISINRPAPKPPLEARPRRMSATGVGKLMRDPYVVYADKILGLKKLDDIDAEVTAAKFGDFIHRALERFTVEYDGKIETLIRFGEEEFAELENLVGVKTFWWPRFLKIAEWFVGNEKEIRKSGCKFLFEEKGKLQIGQMLFTAKADRLEIGEGIKIVDYKTGLPPSFNFVESGLDPQLSIEAIIFGGKYRKTASALEYWYMQGRDKAVEIKSYKDADKLQKMVDAARAGLEQIAVRFLQEDTPYVARPWSKHALKYNDYEHLERIKEWDE